MKCDCIKLTEKQLEEKIAGPGKASSFRPSNARKLTCVGAVNEVYNLMSGTFALAIPFLAVWDMGGTKEKKVTIPVYASFCPFCGKPAADLKPKTETKVN